MARWVEDAGVRRNELKAGGQGTSESQVVGEGVEEIWEGVGLAPYLRVSTQEHIKTCKTFPPTPESPKFRPITRPPKGEFSLGFTPSNILSHHTDPFSGCPAARSKSDQRHPTFLSDHLDQILPVRFLFHGLGRRGHGKESPHLVDEVLPQDLGLSQLLHPLPQE